MTYISSTGPSGKQWPSWSHMVDIANYCTLNYGVSTGFVWIHTFCIDNIFPVLSIKHLLTQYGEPTTPHKLATGYKYSFSNLHVSFCPFVVQKATAQVDTKALNICHHSQKIFRGIFVGIPQYPEGYLIYSLHPWGRKYCTWSSWNWPRRMTPWTGPGACRSWKGTGLVHKQDGFCGHTGESPQW